MLANVDHLGKDTCTSDIEIQTGRWHSYTMTQSGHCMVVQGLLSPIDGHSSEWFNSGLLNLVCDKHAATCAYCPQADGSAE